ncbi:serine hydrolase domain-containing protein [Flagellimonas flava]|uniref:CubicO group peptidase, beta-lactamase class C family n=1 Tax=Flagellimonas flava TaxID=570519 RepID=A0A1M5I2G0_9FLAO|nr:serine hydrolase [Allomuricauda flava]SHG22219.1 CubicO group peptidase, beta-lactamase class C family [Allomuricauda flava]
MKFQRSILGYSALLILNLFLSCKHQEKTSETEPPTKSEEILAVGTIALSGLDSLHIQRMEDSIVSGVYPNIHSVLIYKNEKMVYENYFAGKDEVWGEDLGVIEHYKDSLHDVRSISKSIVATCVGLALQQGKIDSISQSIFDFYPEFQSYKTGLRSQITVEHLLTMTTGMEWNENVPYTDPDNSEIQMTSSPDPIEFVLSRPILIPPGKVWEYNGGTTQLLASLIERATGQNIHEYAKENLFKPLGIANSEWTKFPDIELPAAASGLRLSSRDLMKFGMLYANEGQWRGNQILPKDWAKRAMEPHVWFGRNDNVGYGYQFWIFKAKTITKNYDHLIPAAVGNGGQRIYIDQPNQMIVVITAGNYNIWTIENDSEALLVDFIYPALGKK